MSPFSYGNRSIKLPKLAESREKSGHVWNGVTIPIQESFHKMAQNGQIQGKDGLRLERCHHAHPGIVPYNCPKWPDPGKRRAMPGTMSPCSSGNRSIKWPRILDIKNTAVPKAQLFWKHIISLSAGRTRKCCLCPARCRLRIWRRAASGSLLRSRGRGRCRLSRGHGACWIDSICPIREGSLPA